jgi:cytochrome oxidase Cu insertion factor (SCO1/SenC/PrrC family)
MKPLLFTLTAAVVLAGALAVILVHRASEPASSETRGFRGIEEPPGLTMPDFALRDQEARLVRAQDLRGKVVVLTFLETKCKAACPIIAGEIARAWKLLTPSERAESAAIAITADPRDDTTANIRVFLSRHRASRTIRYLVGPVPVMRDVWRRFLVLSAVASGNADTHSAPVRIYGRDLTWLATQHVGVDLSPRNLAHDILVALRLRTPPG